MYVQRSLGIQGKEQTLQGDSGRASHRTQGGNWQLTRTRGQEEEGTSGPIGKKSMLCLEKEESKSGRLELRVQHGGSER